MALQHTGGSGLSDAGGGSGQTSLSGQRSPLMLRREELASTYSVFFQESTVMAE